MINVSELVTDPDFCQPIQIKRQKCQIVKHRQEVTEETLTFVGVITQADPKTVEMLPEADRLSGAIAVYTREELYTTGTYPEGEYISDIVVYRGREYKVYANVGNMDYGFCESLCTLMMR